MINAKSLKKMTEEAVQKQQKEEDKEISKVLPVFLDYAAGRMTDVAKNGLDFVYLDIPKSILDASNDCLNRFFNEVQYNFDGVELTLQGHKNNTMKTFIHAFWGDRDKVQKK